MKTSARNQFAGTVTAIRVGAVNDEVEIEIPGGHALVAVITRTSTQSLGLQVGGPAIALIKSSSVIVTADDAGMRFSARNRLSGTVAAVTTGAVNGEVLIDVPDSGTVAAIITNESLNTLDLKVGDPASAIFKATSVIVATPI